MLTDLEMKNLAVRQIHTTFSERGIAVNKILLFGSRARGNYRLDSDWDFVVVTEKELLWGEKKEIWRAISRALAKHNISADILIKSQEQFDIDTDDKGKVTYYARHEGAFV
jgi:predicted nucleotidyltransferase